MNKRPSLKFCESGIMDVEEKYIQDIHNRGVTFKERCGKYYPNDPRSKKPYTPCELAKLYERL
jgi:hypothetical protein